MLRTALELLTKPQSKAILQAPALHPGGHLPPAHACEAVTQALDLRVQLRAEEAGDLAFSAGSLPSGLDIRR